MSINNTGSILLRRGPTSDRSLFCPLEGEIIFDTTSYKVFVGDGQTYGGLPVGTSVGSLNDLTDVDTSTSPPTNSQVLTWNSSTSLWVPGTMTSNGVYVLPTATTSTLGGVKVDGSTITISNGVISSTAYTLPTATTSTLGGVKVDGTSITISNGVISSAGGGGSSSAYNRTSFTASAGQTVFNIIYTVNFVNVYVNGTLLDTASYTATNGTSITLSSGCAVGDLVDIFAFSNVTLGAISTATTSTLGGVKIDGSTIQINNGVISSVPVFTKQLNFVGNVLVAAGTIRWYPDANITLTSMFISASTAPIAGPLTLNINKNGSSVTTISLSTNSYRSSNTSINISVLSTDYITVDVTASNGATDAVLTLSYTRN